MTRTNNIIIECERYDVLATDLPRAAHAVLIDLRAADGRSRALFLSPPEARRLANALICAANHYDRETARGAREAA